MKIRFHVVLSVFVCMFLKMGVVKSNKKGCYKIKEQRYQIKKDKNTFFLANSEKFSCVQLKK